MCNKSVVTIWLGLFFSCLTPVCAEETSQLEPKSDLGNIYECPARDEHSCGYTGKIIEETCSASLVKKLGQVNGKEIVMGEYERTVDFDWTKPTDSKPSIYACQGTDSYIFELSEDGKEKSVAWHKFSERSAGMSFVDDAEIYLVGDAAVLVVNMCLDGTGGCYGENYIWVDSAWLPLGKDKSWAEVYEKMPKSYRQHKNHYINFDNMTWEQSIAKSTDPNCCPSGMIKFQLSIKENMLHVESYSFILEDK